MLGRSGVFILAGEMVISPIKSSGDRMTKADLVEIIFEKVGLSKKEAQDIIEIIFDTVKDAFVTGESVKIPGFGTFNVRQKAARRGRNPQTGEELEITPRRVLTFKASNQLKGLVEDAGKSKGQE